MEMQGFAKDNRIIGEETNNRPREDDEQQADRAEKVGIKAHRDSDRLLGPLRMFRPEVLTDERGAGVGQTPSWHEGEDNDANGNGVAC